MQRFHFSILVMLIFSSCIDIAENDIHQSSISPDGKYIAVSFLRSAGATTDYSPQVSILLKNEKFSNKLSGNIFIGYRAKYIDVFWKDDSTLVIRHNCIDKNIFKQLETYNGIKIEYIRATRDAINPEDIKDFEYGEVSTYSVTEGKEQER